MQRNTTRAAILTACLAGATSCNLPLREVGKAPEGAVREKENAVSRAEAARREEARHARLEAGDAAAAPPETTPAQLLRIGSKATQRFHRANCADLGGLPPEDQVRFATPWAALDADYAPCTHCSAGPRR